MTPECQRNASINIAHPLKSDRPIAASRPSVSMNGGVTLPQSSTRGSMQNDQPQAKPMTPDATSMRHPTLPAPRRNDLPKEKSNFVGIPMLIPRSPPFASGPLAGGPLSNDTVWREAYCCDPVASRLRPNGPKAALERDAPEKMRRPESGPARKAVAMRNPSGSRGCRAAR